MTDQQLEVSKKHVEDYTKNVLKYEKPNMQFFKGYIENISGIKEIAKESVDVVISNCVINLCPNKRLVLEEVYKILKFGGEFYFSDVYSNRRLPENVTKNETLYGECVAGAVYINDFIKFCKEVGFTDPRELSRRELKFESDEDSDEKTKLIELLGEAKFYSITYRLFKLKNLEPNCEDYGQYAVYLGNIAESPNGYKLDDHHFFEKNKPELVCGNTAAMLEETWLKPYFKVYGNKIVHYGQFPCVPPKKTESECSGGSCCS
jgi:SAM-dependent methyltransferase